MSTPVTTQEPWTRLTPNASGWVKPSGACGKCRTPNGGLFEGEHGFGFEEWLFNPAHRDGKWQFGYIQAMKAKKHAGRSFAKLQLITRICTKANTLPACKAPASNQPSDGYYQVAVIRNVRCLTHAEAGRVLAHANANGWVQRMLTELAPKQHAEFKLHKTPRERFNVVFELGQVPGPNYAGLVRMDKAFHGTPFGKSFNLFPGGYAGYTATAHGPAWLYGK
jgi:hypothetical protein